MKTHPCDGGCWYCNIKDENLIFSCEFDTFVHYECLQKVIAKNDPNDREAQIMWTELG